MLAVNARALLEVRPSRLSRLTDSERWGEGVARGLGAGVVYQRRRGKPR